MGPVDHGLDVSAFRERITASIDPCLLVVPMSPFDSPYVRIALHQDSSSDDSPSGPWPPLERFRLRGEIDGGERTFDLAPSSTVGSDVSNTVILESVGVSRHHATLQVQGGRVTVIDGGSKNGTFVNGHAASRAELAVGDRVAFGGVELTLELLHPGDTRLAVELFAPSPRPPGSWGMETRTLAGGGETTSKWLHWVGRSLARCRASSKDFNRLLDFLLEELPVSGAALVDLSQGSEPRILHTAGRLAGGVAQRLADRWRNEAPRPGSLLAGEGVFLEQTEPPFVAWVGDGERALVLCGEFQGREESRGLLQILFEILMPTLGGSTGHAPAAAEGLQGLRFPPGYVRSVAPSMVVVYEQMRPLVLGDLPVLIRGETGVGKELIAHALHLSSSRRDGPFVAINCAAIPSELLEAELFGIGERVATGVAGRRGTFQRAEGGTLFLDEVGEMPAELQAKLLRVLQEKRLHPLGAAPVEIDVRVVAATNADIDALMEQGSFRQDLYFRIAGFVLHMPPLRQRREDVPLLVERFLRRFCDEIGKPVRGVTVRALDALQDHPWPGNVRQLEHEMRRLVYLCPAGEAIEQSMLTQPEGTPLESPRSSPQGAADAAPETSSPLPSLELAILERLAVEEALRRVDGNQGQAAQLLGITRSSLRRRLKRHEL